MLNVPQEVRSELAPQMKHPQLREIFVMTDEEKADEHLLKLGRRQTGMAEDLARAWATVGPMLLENEAISRFRAKNPDWSSLLPEILTIQEACRIAQADYMLTEKQVQNLAAALKRPLPRSRG